MIHFLGCGRSVIFLDTRKEIKLQILSLTFVDETGYVYLANCV